MPRAAAMAGGRARMPRSTAAAMLPAQWAALAGTATCTARGTARTRRR
uniref:Uncharacterized protein n=1 Tax=Arundo donax TaxID=35708 RepID=A0A0A9E332_ARUDO